MVATVIFLTTTGAGTWPVPSDWNSSDNLIEVIASGGNGGSFAGGGGAYSAKSNVPLTPGASVPLSIGRGQGAPLGGEDTWFGDATYANAIVGAEGGNRGGAGIGGRASSGIGSIRYSGGSGIRAGGGAGGPFGNGADGGGGGFSAGGGGAGGGSTGSARVGLAGGAGGNNHLGSGGGAGGLSTGGNGQPGTAGGGGGGGSANDDDNDWLGGSGGAGTEWDVTHGSGGGGGAPTSTAVRGGHGGLYGGGAGSGSTAFGGQGLIVITYTPGGAPDQNITGELFSNSNTVFAAALALSISGGLFTDPDTFYGATVTRGPAPQSISGGLFTNANAFFAAGVTQIGPDQVISGELFIGKNRFFAATASAEAPPTRKPGGGYRKPIIYLDDKGRPVDLKAHKARTANDAIQEAKTSEPRVFSRALARAIAGGDNEDIAAEARGLAAVTANAHLAELLGRLDQLAMIQAEQDEKAALMLLLAF